MKWIKVFEGISEVEGELILSFLKSEGLSAVIINKRSSPYQIGRIEVHVPENQHIVAENLIKSYLNLSNIIV